MLQSPNQTANQIRLSHKNDQSNIFLTVGNDVGKNEEEYSSLLNIFTKNHMYNLINLQVVYPHKPILSQATMTINYLNMTSKTVVC